MVCNLISIQLSRNIIIAVTHSSMSKAIFSFQSLKFHVLLLIVCLDSFSSFGNLRKNPKFNIQKINSKHHYFGNNYLSTSNNYLSHFRLQLETDDQTKNEDPSTTLQTSSQIARLNAKASILRAEAASLEVLIRYYINNNFNLFSTMF